MADKWPVPPYPGIWPPPPDPATTWWDRIKEDWQARGWQALAMLGGAVVAMLTPLAAFVSSILLFMLKNVLGHFISGLFTIGSMSVFRSLVERTPDEAIEWLKKAAEAFRVPSGAWAVFVSDIMYTLTGTAIDPKPFLDLGVGPGSRQAVQALGDAYLQPMLGLIMPRAGEVSTQVGIRAEDGLQAANRFFGVNLTFQMQAWLLHMLGDTFSFGMWKGMKDLPNAISWSFGIGWLSWLVMGTPFRMTIADPLERLYNRIYRPFRFSMAKLADAFWRDLISPSYFTKQMQELGIPDNLYDVIVEMERTKMTDAQALRLHRMGKLGLQDLIDHQRAQGHSPEDAQILATEMTRREVGALLEGVAKTATKHYKDRRMSDSELRGFLREGGWTDEEAGIIIQDLQMQMALEVVEEVKERALTPANIARLYQLGKRTRQWAETKLTQRLFKVNEISDFLELYEPKVPKEPEPREPPAGLIGWLYQRGMITLEEARGRWRDVEIEEVDIPLYAMRYAPPVPPPPLPPREFSPTEVGRLYRDHFLVLPEALRRLRADPIRMRVEDAEMYLEAFYEPVEVTEPPAREAPVSVVGALYKKGQETLATFEEHLDLLNYSPASKEFLIKTYTLPPEEPPAPLPPMEFRPSTIGRLYQRQGIQRQEALGRLEALKPPMTTADAILYLDTLYAPEEEE